MSGPAPAGGGLLDARGGVRAAPRPSTGPCGRVWNEALIRSVPDLTMPRVSFKQTMVVGAATWPVGALASQGVLNQLTSGDTQAIALLGVAAAFAWHHLSRRKGMRWGDVAMKWQQMHVGDRLPHLRLGERLHGFHLREALSAALHLRRDARAAPIPEPRRVLIVDDDEDVRTALGEILSSEGFAVSEAADGIEGLRRAREERPDVILLDLVMPRMDGFEFRAAQRTDSRLAAVPVVVISAADRPAPVGGLDAAAYLDKPCDVRVLLDAVGRHAVAAVAAA
jgi:CheY-like chemotaxis protein